MIGWWHLAAVAGGVALTGGVLVALGWWWYAAELRADARLRAGLLAADSDIDVALCDPSGGAR